MVAQPQPGGLVDLVAVLVAEERVGPRGPREDPLVEAADEQRPHAPRAQVLRARDLHAAGPGSSPTNSSSSPSVRSRSSPVPASAGSDCASAAELVERLARHRRHARVEPLGAGEHRRLAPRTARRTAAPPRAPSRRQSADAPRCASRRTSSIASSGNGGAPPTARAPPPRVRAPSLRARCSRSSASAGTRRKPGVRSQVSRSSAVASSCAQRASAISPRPSAVWPSGTRRVSAYGIP